MRIGTSQAQNPDEWEPAVSIMGSRDSKDRESRESMHFGIENPVASTRDKTAVTGIVVIWARSLARRASV